MVNQISLKEHEAQQWIENVIAEVKEVNAILQRATDACMTSPEEEDDLMKAFADWGRELNNLGTKMCTNFDKATQDIKNALTNLFKTLAERQEDMKQQKAKVGK